MTIMIRVKQYFSSPWWLYLLSFLILGSMSHILFGGFKGMLEFKKGYEVDLSLNLHNLRFFTKNYINQIYQQLTVKSLPQNTTLPEFHIYTDEQSLESLDSYLPSSGKTQYRQGHLRVDPTGLTSPIEFRYRGGLPLHWLYKKKSFRVKLPPFTTYLGERQFNLVNPSTIHTITDWVSYDMARAVGLLTPTYFPVRVYINDATNGLHFFLSRIDESLLRKNRRMPGSIYSGDTVYVANPFKEANATEMREQVYPDKDGVSLMWKDYRLWSKNSSRNAESSNDRTDIQKFIEVINKQDPVQFMKGFETYFDSNKFNIFWGLDSLVGGYHHDLFHNHKIYFDPYKGKVEPIEWDVRYWSSNVPMPDYPLLKQVRLNPVLDFERNQILYDLWKKFPVNDITSQISEKSETVASELAADPYRQHPDKYNRMFTKEKVVPFSMKQFNEAIEALKLTYKARHIAVKKMLDYSSASFMINSLQPDAVAVEVSVTGESPVDIDLWSLVPEQLKHQVEIIRVYQNHKLSSLEQHTLERLFPGKTIKPGNAIGKADDWTTITYGKVRLEPSALQYSYQIKGVNLKELVNTESLTAVNAVTAKVIKASRVSTLPDSVETNSIHPWALPQSAKDLQHVILSGDITILQDHVYNASQVVEILPGTTFKIAKGRSLVFYGRVMVKGDSNNPVRFTRYDASEPWGSVIIQGAAASGSILQHIEVSGGSISTQGLIHYPGQLNIHDVNFFNLEHCVIQNNSIGDDALHIAYSHGKVSNCRFNNTAFDALDMDIVDVTLSQSEFTNVGNDAVDLMSSRVDINELFIQGTGDKCFSIGESSDVRILNSQLNSCQIGVAVKDESKAYLENLKFSDMQNAAIALYRKNARYGVGGEVSGKSLYGISPADITVDRGSVNHIANDQLFPSVDLVSRIND